MRRGHKLTNFSVQGKSNSLTNPKSSPVTMFRPPWDTHAQLTSALSAFRGQIPKTSSPRMLKKRRQKGRVSAAARCRVSSGVERATMSRVCALPGPRCPGDSVDGDRVAHQLSRRNLEHLPLISSRGHLQVRLWCTRQQNECVCVCDL